jgi:hypothetical protein
MFVFDASMFILTQVSRCLRQALAKAQAFNRRAGTGVHLK